MKRNTSATIILLLIFAIVIQFILNYRGVERLKRQMAIEQIKTDFTLRQLGIEDRPYDSVYAQYDTVSFYKNGTFLGKTIIVKE